MLLLPHVYRNTQTHHNNNLLLPTTVRTPNGNRLAAAVYPCDLLYYIDVRAYNVTGPLVIQVPRSFPWLLLLYFGCCDTCVHVIIYTAGNREGD